MPAASRALTPILIACLMFVTVVAACWTSFAKAASGSDSPWGVNYFPNTPLTTQDGKPVRFYDDLIKGKVVAINFIFTGCSAACSMETARLREVQELLGDRMGKDVFFYSISLDPDNDTPEALRHYANKFNVGPGWVFLTGRNEDITQLRVKLGLYLPGAADNKNDHNLSLIVGNQSTGRWMRASPFENPHVLATQLGSWLHNWRLASADKNDYANAPTRLRQMSRGEELYRTRCAPCHVIGKSSDRLASLRAIGPDLAGVTRMRERAWLKRWLKEPDKMLAEKDPIATALFVRYNKVAMPNLSLSEADITALISYFEEEDEQATASRKLARQ